MNQPLRVHVRLASMRIEDVSDIAVHWPYKVTAIATIGKGMWKVSSKEARDHMVCRGFNVPIEKAWRKGEK